MPDNQVLAPLKPKTKPFKYAVFDIESSNWVNFELLGFYDGEKYLEFKSVKEFLEYILVKRYAFTRMFAHAGGRFDFNFIIDALNRHFKDYEYQILSGQGISEIRIFSESQNRAWIFKDSYRLLPMSLKKLTEIFNVEHKKQEIDYANITRDWEKLREYLKYDVVGLYEVIGKFKEWFYKYQVPLQTTLASQSMAMFRTQLKTSIPVLPEKVEAFVRKGYFGGRVEIFKMQALKHIYCYDFSSLYPLCMVKYPVPVGKPVYTSFFKPDEIGFYKADVKIPNVYVPPMPIVDRHKLLFPYGRITGFFSSKELEVLQDLGGDINIHYGYVFSGDYIFSDYIRDMYERKRTAKDPMERLIYKLLLNSCYGKFAQSRIKDKLIRVVNLKDAIGLKPYDPAYNLFSETTLSRATFIIPSIASWITSCARYELYKALTSQKEEHIYYADSVTGDTPILIRRNKKFIDFAEIQELNPTNQLRYNGKALENIEALSKNGWADILYVYKHKTDKPIYVLAGNIYCKATGDHSVFQDGKEKKVSELKIGEKIDTANIPDTLRMKGITEDYARLLGYFAAEGTCGTYDNQQYGVRYSWALNDADNKKLEKYRSILESVFGRTFKILDCIASSGCNKLVPVGKIKYLSIFFREMCYTKSGNKKIPSIIFNSDISIMKAYLDGYMEGDGYYINKGYDKNGQKRNDSISYILQAGISFLSAKIGFKSRFLIRDDKLNIIGHFQSMKTKEGITRIRKENSSDYVYDISTSDGTFVGGCNLVIFHNTDSIFTDKQMPTGDNLGDLKLELEGDGGIFILPKLYAIKMKDGSSKIKAKGFEQAFVKSHLSFKSFERALHGNTLDFKQTVRKFASFKESMKRNSTCISMISQSKSIQSTYDKRRILKNLDTEAWKYPRLK